MAGKPPKLIQPTPDEFAIEGGFAVRHVPTDAVLSIDRFVPTADLASQAVYDFGRARERRDSGGFYDVRQIQALAVDVLRNHIASFTPPAQSTEALARTEARMAPIRYPKLGIV